MDRATLSIAAHVRRALVAAAIVAIAAAGAVVFVPLRAQAADVPSSTPPAVESSATTPAPLPLPAQMASTGSAEQMVIATGRTLGSTWGFLRVYDKIDGAWVQTLTVPARFGRRGLMDGARRKAGNLTTPTGIWRMPGYVFGTHTRAPSGTRMAYRRMTWKSWWSSKRGWSYNRWVEARRWTGEHIGGSPKAYEFAVSTGYNALPNRSVYGRGTGIFLHVRGAGLTAGCVAISRADMIRVCRILDPKKQPYFAVGTLQRGTPTSIWAY